MKGGEGRGGISLGNWLSESGWFPDSEISQRADPPPLHMTGVPQAGAAF